MELASSARVIEVRENAPGVCRCCWFYCFLWKVRAATQQIPVCRCSLSRTVLLGPRGVGDLLASGGIRNSLRDILLMSQQRLCRSTSSSSRRRRSGTTWAQARFVFQEVLVLEM